MDELVRILVSLSDKNFVCEALELCPIYILGARKVYIVYENALLFAHSDPGIAVAEVAPRPNMRAEYASPATPC